MSKPRKKNKHLIPSWKGHPTDNKFVQLYKGLLTSDAYISLSHRQKSLYTFMMLQIKHENNTEFAFNWTLANKVYKLYTNKKSFYDDIKKLQEAGFIEYVVKGKYTRTNSIYKPTADWKGFGLNEHNKI